MRLAKAFISIPLLTLGWTGAAWGQANPKTSSTCFLDEETPLQCQILVVGNLPTSLAEDSEAIVGLDSDSPERTENLIRDVAGLQQFRRSDARSANPTSQGVTLRGLGGNASSRAALFLDGVPQADPFGGWVSWPSYDTLNLASIRVRRGGGQPSAGPGAIAGIIELDSRQKPLGKFAQAHIGSRNSLAASAGALFSLGAGSLSASGSYARSDGFTPISQGQRGDVDRGAKYEQAGLNLRAVAPVSDDIQLQANMRAFFDERDRGFDFSDNQNSGVDASLRLANLFGEWQWSALAYIQLREFSTRFGAVEDDRNSVRLVLDQYSVPSTGLGARAEIRPPLGDNAELRIGADWRRTIGETNETFFFIADVPQRSRNAGGRTDSFGAFAEGSWKPADDLTLSLGGRADRWNIANGFRRQVNLATGDIQSDEAFANRADWEGTGRAGLAWKFGADDEFTFRSSAYLGWRLPTLNELYRPFRVGAVTTLANEALQPERLKGAEIGLDYENGDDVSFSITAFWNKLDNAIANVEISADGNTRQRLNLDAVNSRGVELDASYDLAYAAGMNTGYESLILRASYAYVDAKIDGFDTTAALDGARPAQVPRHFANLSLDYNDRPGLKAGFTLRYIGRQFEDEANSRVLDDAFTLDARLGHILGSRENMTIEARAENLFDAEIQTAISASGVVETTRPRTLWLGLRVKL